MHLSFVKGRFCNPVLQIKMQGQLKFYLCFKLDKNLVLVHLAKVTGPDCSVSSAGLNILRKVILFMNDL